MDEKSELVQVRLASMLRFLLMVLVSWSVSSWILTETFFFFPSLKPVVQLVEDMITIPRHDEWEFDRFEKEATWLDRKLASNSYTFKWSNFFGGSDTSVEGRARYTSNLPFVFDRTSLDLDKLDDGIPLRQLAKLKLRKL